MVYTTDRHSSSSSSLESEQDGLLSQDIEKQAMINHLYDDVHEKPEVIPPAHRSTAFLDGLRGVAALCVFNQHFIGPGDHEHGFGQAGQNYTFTSMPFIRVFYNGGAAAVSIFFVLSGFVLSQTSIKLFYKGKHGECKKSLVSAVVRRPFRLYLPCLAVTLLIASAMHLPYNLYPDLFYSQAKESIFAEISNCLVTFYQYFQPFQYHGNELFWFPYNTVVWTIPIELKGSMLIYAVVPVCCFGLVSQDWSVGLLSFAVWMLMKYGWWWHACFLGGLAIAIVDLYDLDSLNRFTSIQPLTRHLTPRIKFWAMNVLFVVAYFLISQPAVAGRREYSHDTPGWRYLSTYIPQVYGDAKYYRFWQSYGSILFVYTTLRLEWLQMIFGSTPLRYLGKVSFMLYLVHQPLFISVGDRFVRLFGQIGLGSPEKWWDNMLYVPDIGPEGLSLRWCVDWTIMLAITLVVAHVATTYIDEPSVRLGQWLSRKLGLGPPEKAAPFETHKRNRSGSLSRIAQVYVRLWAKLVSQR